MKYNSIQPVKSTKDTVHQYWQNPDDRNRPETYTRGILRSKLLFDIIKSHGIKREAKILEIGCNVGRNLNFLQQNGFENLSAIEISTNAIKKMSGFYPGLQAKVYNTPVEKIIKSFQNSEFDLVYSIAVLEHIHPDSEWIFAQISRIAKNVVTIEDEAGQSWRHFPRDYKKIFEIFGMSQVYELSCNPASHDLNTNFMARMFTK